MGCSTLVYYINMLICVVIEVFGRKYILIIGSKDILSLMKVIKTL